MRVARPIGLTPESRVQLERQARGRSVPMRVALRSRIVLPAADGKQHKQISEELKSARGWRRCGEGDFFCRGRGIAERCSSAGRTPSIPAAMVNTVIKKTTQTTPANAPHWSTRTMAREVGISEASVRRIWHAHGLKPHLVKTFKVSRDPEFAGKLEAIVGLYLNPPEHALVLCVDEKSQIQALDRTQPGLPLKKGRGQTMTHDYKRNGTATLFAALDTLNGEVFGLCQERHRHQEWLKFLRLIDQTIPQEKHIYLICDNYATHKHEKVIRWLDRHKRFHVYFTPTSASWLNMVERFFRDLTQNQLRRGIFTNLEQLIMAIGNYIDQHNQNPKPFIWTAKASDILEKVTRAQASLDKRLSV